MKPGLDTASATIVIKPGHEGRLIVRFPYSPEHVAKIKTVVGRRWHQQEKHWTVPQANGDITHLLALFAGERTEVDPSLYAVNDTPREESFGEAGGLFPCSERPSAPRAGAEGRPRPPSQLPHRAGIQSLDQALPKLP